MSQEIESLYDGFLTTISSKLRKIDPELTMRVMEYERKFSEVEPAVNLHINYKTGTNREKKLDEVRSKYEYCTAREGETSLLVQGNMSLKTIEEISNDPEIESITGFASIASY
jgi:hypothetical protein